MKLSEAINSFTITRTRDLSPTTMAMYLWALKILQDFTGDLEVKQINVDMLRQLYHYIHRD